MNYEEAVKLIERFGLMRRLRNKKTKQNEKTIFEKKGRLLSMLGNPQDNIPKIIHINGTSGKGSVSLYLFNILSAGEKQTGLMVSPHPTTMRERFYLNGRVMTEDEFVNLVEYLLPFFQEFQDAYPDDELSYFDIVFAIGLLYFTQNKVEYAVIETGVESRYDSTNILTNKTLCIITNIGLDHEKKLGKTKKDIAISQCGIMRVDVPTISAEDDLDIQEVIIHEAKRQNFKLIFIDRNYTLVSQSIEETTFIHNKDSYTLPTFGKHQIINALLAIEASKFFNISKNAIKDGLKQTILPLRMEVMNTEPLIILDSAHNQDKLSSVILAVKSISQNRKIHILLALNRKFEDDVYRDILTLKPKSITISKHLHNSFVTPIKPQEIAKKLQQFTDLKINIYEDWAEALQSLLSKIKPDEILLITGSTFMSGELRPILQNINIAKN